MDFGENDLKPEGHFGEIAHGSFDNNDSPMVIWKDQKSSACSTVFIRPCPLVSSGLKATNSECIWAIDVVSLVSPGLLSGIRWTIGLQCIWCVTDCNLYEIGEKPKYWIPRRAIKMIRKISNKKMLRNLKIIGQQQKRKWTRWLFSWMELSLNGVG